MREIIERMVGRQIDGFRVQMMTSQRRRRIAIVGGYGVLGRALATNLMHLAHVECMIVGRRLRKARRVAAIHNCSARACNVEHEPDVAKMLAEVDLVIDAAGPFQQRTPLLAKACLEWGVHYIDFSDDLGYGEALMRLDSAARRQGVMLVTGAGSLTALASVLTDMVVGDFDSIDGIDIHAVWGNQIAFGPASYFSLLSKLGKVTRIKMRRRWHDQQCWTQPVRVDFPSPVGRLTTYLYDVSGIEQFARHYQANATSFHLGMPGMMTSWLLAMIARLRDRGWFVRPYHLARMIHLLRRILGRMGQRFVVIQAIVTGMTHHGQATHIVSFLNYDERTSGLVTSLAVTLCSQFIESGVVRAGAHSGIALLGIEDIKPVLADHGVKIVRS